MNKLYKIFEINGVAIVPFRIKNHSQNHPYPNANWMVRHAKKAGAKWIASDHYTLVSGREMVDEKDMLKYLIEQIEVTKKCIALASISKQEIKAFLDELNKPSKIINAPTDSLGMLELTPEGVKSKIIFKEIDSPKYYPEFWLPILEALEKTLLIMHKEYN